MLRKNVIKKLKKFMNSKPAQLSDSVLEKEASVGLFYRTFVYTAAWKGHKGLTSIRHAIYICVQVS